MLDKSKTGYATEPMTAEVEKGHIRRFAEAIGDDNPLWSDEDAAREGPFGAVAAPPTFIQPLIMKSNQAARAGLDYDPKKLLHGEQHYEYFKPVTAGMKLTVTSTITDIYEKEGRSGAMDFFVVETNGDDESGERVFTARAVLVVRREVK